MAGPMSSLLNGIRAALLGGQEWSSFVWGDASTWGDTDSASPYKERILIGSKQLCENLGPPCITLVAGGASGFTGPEGPGQNPEVPVIGTKTVTFEAHCWGAASKTIPNDVYTQAEELADAVFTALRAVAGDGNARIAGEEFEDSGLAAGGVVLVRSFTCEGIGIEEIKLPLTRPIDLNAATMVTAVGPFGQTAPYDDSGVPATDGSIGVQQNGS